MKGLLASTEWFYVIIYITTISVNLRPVWEISALDLAIGTTVPMLQEISGYGSVRELRPEESRTNGDDEEYSSRSLCYYTSS